MASPQRAVTRVAAVVAVSLLTACGSGATTTQPTTVASASTTTVERSGSDEVFTPGTGLEVRPASTIATTTTAAPPLTDAPTSAPTTSVTTTATTSIAVTTTSTTVVATTSAPAPTTTATTAPAPAPVAPAEGTSPCPPTGQRVWNVNPASDIPAPPLPDGWRTESAGASVQGRELTVLVRPVDDPARTVMVIGGIHGNEPVSPPTVRAMVEAAIPDDTEVWLLPLMNPDGSAAGTRCNANGVDLNRNFSWLWRSDNGGPGPFSEPEPVAAAALVERVAPDVVVWVHQPLGYVSSIGNTPDSYEQAWSAGSGVRVRPDVSQQGGGESWTAFVAGLPSMLVEVDSYDARPDMVAAHVGGFAALLDVVIPR